MNAEVTFETPKGTKVIDLDDPAQTGTIIDVMHIESGYVKVRWTASRRVTTIHTDNLAVAR